MSENAKRASVYVPRSEAAVEMTVSSGTNLESILRSAELAAAIRGVRGRGGCPTCISGHPIFIKEDFGEVVAVEFEA